MNFWPKGNSRHGVMYEYRNNRQRQRVIQFVLGCATQLTSTEYPGGTFSNINQCWGTVPLFCFVKFALIDRKRLLSVFFGLSGLTYAFHRITGGSRSLSHWKDSTLVICKQWSGKLSNTLHQLQIRKNQVLTPENLCTTTFLADIGFNKSKIKHFFLFLYLQ